MKVRVAIGGPGAGKEVSYVPRRCEYTDGFPYVLRLQFTTVRLSKAETKMVWR